MELILVRHGVAEDPGPRTRWGDEPRELTAEGAERMRRAAAGLAAIGVAPEVIVTSPLPRCRQTAEIIRAAVGGTLEPDDRMRPGMDPDELVDILIGHPGAGCLLACGHQPDLSDALAALTGALVPFRKGGAAMVDLPAPRMGAGTLTAVLPPKVLRALAR
jgi:phosphohistidine phosphatase